MKLTINAKNKHFPAAMQAAQFFIDGRWTMKPRNRYHSVICVLPVPGTTNTVALSVWGDPKDNVKVRFERENKTKSAAVSRSLSA